MQSMQRSFGLFLPSQQRLRNQPKKNVFFCFATHPMSGGFRHSERIYPWMAATTPKQQRPLLVASRENWTTSFQVTYFSCVLSCVHVLYRLCLDSGQPLKTVASDSPLNFPHCVQGRGRPKEKRQGAPRKKVEKRKAPEEDTDTLSLFPDCAPNQKAGPTSWLKKEGSNSQILE